MTGMRFSPACFVAAVAVALLAAPASAGPTGLAHSARPRAAANRIPPPFPPAPLFVADPTLNAIVVYDSSLTGSVGPSSVWPASAANQLNHPSAVTTGLDCLAGSCGHYVWVLNGGNNTVTSYAIPFTGAPAFVRKFRANGACANSIFRPSGIAHAKGRLYIASSAGSQISMFNSNSNGPVCPLKKIRGSATMLSTPSGPSVSFPANPTVNYVFTTSTGKVTGYPQNANLNVAPTTIWTPGGSYGEGTTTDWNLGFLWQTTAAIQFGVDGLWLCPGLPLPTGCPTSPTISGTSTGLDRPGLPTTSVALGTVFAPNYNPGTVTEYSEFSSGNVSPVATFTGLAHPTGTAVENAPD